MEDKPSKEEQEQLDRIEALIDRIDTKLDGDK